MMEGNPAEDDGTQVGSTGSIDALDVDTDRDDTRGTGLLGKSSAVAWAKRTAEECGPSNNRASSSGSRNNQFTINSYHTEDADIEDNDMSNIDMFEWPDARLAAALVRSYFDYVHATFPIVDKAAFFLKYTNFSAGSRVFSQEDLIWLSSLNTIFAISTVFSHLSKSQSRANPHDHLIFEARAKMLCLDQGVLYRDARISTVRALGLLCLYYVSTCRLNRYQLFILTHN